MNEWMNENKQGEFEWNVFTRENFCFSLENLKCEFFCARKILVVKESVAKAESCMRVFFVSLFLL